MQSTCPCCVQPHARSFCGKCINEGVVSHHNVVSQTAREASSSVDLAVAYLGPHRSMRGVRNWRTARAEAARSRRRCEDLAGQIQAADNALGSGKLNTAKPHIHAKVRANRHLPTLPRPLDGDIAEALSVIDRKQLDVTQRLTEARRVLVHEAVSVFGVFQASHSGWEIAGLPLPSPDAMRLHRSNRINVALSHVVHLLSLITRYLGVGLPFYPSQSAPHLGRPRMKANTPLIGTTRFHDEPVLWMSSTTRVDTADKPKSQAKHRRFLTAFALLAHSVAYLAHTQGTTGVGIPHDIRPNATDDAVIPVWSILQLLDALATSPQLGTFSHEPGGPRSASHLLYGLDVAKAVGSIIRSEERRWGPHNLHPSDLSEGWDLMESADEGGPT